MTWSNALCASRMLPSAARAISSSAASSGCRSSPRRRSSAADRRSAPCRIVRNSNTCDRDRIVSGILCELGRRHHEDDVRRRLFDRLEQRVERRGREPVHLVDDEHLVAVAHRGDRQALDDHLADVVDAGVGGGVDLEHVDVAPLGDLDARIARRRRDRPSAPSRSSAPAPGCARVVVLPHAARAGKHERLRDAPAG